MSAVAGAGPEAANRTTDAPRPANIAVVDDDSGFAGYLRTFLALRGYEARSYTRGDEIARGDPAGRAARRRAARRHDARHGRPRDAARR